MELLTIFLYLDIQTPQNKTIHRHRFELIDISRRKIEQIFKKFGPELQIRSIQKFGGGGLYNHLRLVQIEKNGGSKNPDQFVLRIAPTDNLPKLFYEHQMMHSEPLIHALVRSHTGVPVPEIYHYDFDRGIIDSDYLIMEYLPGMPGRFSHQELGRYVRQLHRITGKQFGYPKRDLPILGTWRETFLDYARRILTNCLDVGAVDQNEFRWFLGKYKKHQDALREPEHALLHLDLWSNNILTRGGAITGIMDFDRGMFGDPELEFAVPDTYGYSTEAFFQGYRKERPWDEPAQVRQRLYYVYEIIKYAFIRLARGGMLGVARSFVEESRRMLRDL